MVAVSDPELTTALSEFTWAFEQVFHHDWAYARAMLLPANGMIAPDGTFLEPRVEDEVDDWGYRAMLLQRYRKLRALMEARGITPVRGFGESTAG